MQDRRRYQRYQVCKPGQIVGAGSRDCVIVDISVNGARLSMVSTAGVPNTIELSFAAMRMVRRCEVMWRASTEMGVEFTDRASRFAA